MASDLKKELLELLERDREFRLSVAGLLGYKEILEELKRLREDMHRGFEEHSRRFDENDRKFNEILEELKLHREKLEEHDFKFDSMMRKLDALGARWGILAESAFREGTLGIVERLFGGSVERWIHDDRDGFVFGYPATVEVDIVMRDGEHILVEIKSHVRKGDVGVLLRKGELYKRVKGITPRLVFVSPYIDEDARSDAEMLGIETYNA